jgi:hypothetical protein
MLYISSQSQMIHTTPRCSVTRRNLAQNLQTQTSAANLALMGYRGCKRCGADLELAQASSTPCHFAVVQLSSQDQPAEAAEQVMRATVDLLAAAPQAQLHLIEASTGSDSTGLVIATAPLTEDQATELWAAYPYDQEALAQWAAQGWQLVEGQAL